MHIHARSKESRAKRCRAQCSRVQHFRIVILNSRLEKPFRTHWRHRSRLEQPLRAHWRHRAGSNSLFERLFEPFCVFLRLFEPFWAAAAKALKSSECHCEAAGPDREHLYIYILAWTRAYTCTEQSRAESSGSEHSVAEPSTFE